MTKYIEKSAMRLDLDDVFLAVDLQGQSAQGGQRCFALLAAVISARAVSSSTSNRR